MPFTHKSRLALFKQPGGEPTHPVFTKQKGGDAEVEDVDALSQQPYEEKVPKLV